MIETKPKIDIKELVIADPKKEGEVFDVNEYLLVKELAGLEQQMRVDLKSERFHSFISDINSLRILSPQNADRISVPESVIKYYKKEIKAQKKLNFLYFFQLTALICNAVPSRRKEFMPSENLWTEGEHNLYEYADQDLWIQFILQGAYMKMINPNWKRPVLMNHEIKNMKSCLRLPVNFDVVRPLENHVGARILFPEEKNLYYPNKNEWKELGRHLNTRNDESIDENDKKIFLFAQYFETLADAKILTADDVKLTADAGLEIINHEKDTSLHPEVKTFPERRKF